MVGNCVATEKGQAGEHGAIASIEVVHFGRPGFAAAPKCMRTTGEYVWKDGHASFVCPQPR